MTNFALLKKNIWTLCEQQVQQRIQTIESVLGSITESRNNETKSSVGDKYETGRAMMQQAEDQNTRQLMQAKQDLLVLNQIKNKLPQSNIELGSLVKTTNGNMYYMAIGIGKLMIEQQKVFVISPDAPIGKQLMFKKVKQDVQFNHIHCTIQSIW